MNTETVSFIKIDKHKIKTPADARLALTINRSMKQVAEDLKVDYDLLRQTLIYGKPNQRVVTAVCSELGIKPEILTGGDK